MSSAEWTCGCGAVMLVNRRSCDNCGASVPKGTRRSSPTMPARPCPIDGVLLVEGWCSVAQGYPLTERCPFVCPQCRQRLDWNGACFQCRTVPGDRWEYGHAGLHPTHYRLTAKGPGRTATQSEVTAAVQAIDAVLAHAQVAGRLGGRPGRPVFGVRDRAALRDLVMARTEEPAEPEPTWITEEEPA